MIPSMGMNPFYLSATGRKSAHGDIINARHPYLGNGTLAIFQSIKSICDHLDRYTENHDETLSQDIMRLEHQLNNLPRMAESCIQYLKYLEALTIQSKL